MNTTIKLVVLTIIAFTLATSCTKEGPAGKDGIDGLDGKDGEVGNNGIDGNANVRTFKYDISAESGSTIRRNLPELTSEVVENDLILGYLFGNDGRVLPIPSSFRSNGGPFIHTIVDIGGGSNGGYYSVLFRLSDGFSHYNVFTGEFLELKIIIAKSSSITTGKSPATDVLTSLKSSGISISDYYAVMDYFQLEY